MHIVSTGTQLCDKCGKPMGNARVANSQGTFHTECAGFSPFARIAELEAALRNLVADCDDYARINNLSGTWATIEQARNVLTKST